MDVNAPEFVPGALSADAAEFVPLAARQMASPSLGMSSEAPEFVPGKLQGSVGLNGMPVFSMNGYESGASGVSSVRGMASDQHVPAIVASNAAFMDGVSGTGSLGDVEPSSFHDNKEWASWNRDVNSMEEEDGNWDPETDVKWDGAGPRWEPEDNNSRTVHLPQARVGMFMGSKSSTVQYMDQLHHERISVDQDLRDMGVTSAHLAGTSHDEGHRGENALDAFMAGQLHSQDRSHLEAGKGSDTPWDITARRAGIAADACPELHGTKVALDVLFPNLDRSMDEDASRGSAALDRRQQGTVTARLPGATANNGFREWGSSNNRFDCSPGLPTCFSQSRSAEGSEQEMPGSLGEDALNIAESVAAMALGLDMEDESPHERRADNDAFPAEPATASQSMAFAPPPSAPSSALNGMVSLHDVLPMQDSLWQPPPRIPPLSSAKLQGPADEQNESLTLEHPDEASSPGMRRQRLLPPPPPSEPPPPPPAELMRPPLHLQCDQAVALHSS